MTDPTPQTTPTRDEAVLTGWKPVPVEPTEEMIEAMREAARKARRGGISGMTIDAQFRAEHRPEYASYAAMLASAPAPASGGVDVEALTYRVANAKLGEGPAVRCEGPTDFEKDQARAWVKRVLRAQASLSPAATPVSEAGGEAVRTVAGETCMGMPVAAYMAKSRHGPQFNPQFATHWSTLPDYENPERLFREADVRAALAKPASPPAGGDVASELEAERRRFDYVRVQRDALAAELQNRVSAEHEVLMVEALAEIKATVDGESDQPVRDIVYGLLAEIEALPKRTLSQSTSAGRVGE